MAELRHYAVTITPAGGTAHEVGDGVDAPSALGALVQIVEAELRHGTAGPILVLDQDGRLREFVGVTLQEPQS